MCSDALSDRCMCVQKCSILAPAPSLRQLRVWTLQRLVLVRQSQEKVERITSREMNSWKWKQSPKHHARRKEARKKNAKKERERRCARLRDWSEVEVEVWTSFVPAPQRGRSNQLLKTQMRHLRIERNRWKGSAEKKRYPRDLPQIGRAEHAKHQVQRAHRSRKAERSQKGNLNPKLKQSPRRKARRGQRPNRKRALKR